MCMPHTADRRDRADRSIDGEAWMRWLRVFCIDCLPIRSLSHDTHRMLAHILHRIETAALAPVRSGSPQLTRKQRTRHRSRVFLLLHTRYTRCRGVCMEVLTGIRVCYSRGVLNSLTPRRRSSRRCKSCTGSRPRRGERRTPSASSRRKAAACRRRRRGKSPAPEQA